MALNNGFVNAMDYQKQNFTYYYVFLRKTFKKKIIYIIIRRYTELYLHLNGLHVRRRQYMRV